MLRQHRERGVVSLMVTMVMIIVITLIVLGFSEIARNEQRSSLDQQLSTQAYYAAESGINDIRSVIDATIAAGGTVQDKTVCGSQGPYNASSDVDAAHNVSYTCVLVNTAPTTLTYTLGSTSTVVPLISVGPSFGNINLNFKVAAGSTASAAGCYTLAADLGNNPVTNQWTCNYPMLQVDILDANGALSRSALTAATTTFFVVPFDSSTVNNNVGLGAKGVMVPARCDGTGCAIHLSSMSGRTYYMRLTALYRTNSAISIDANSKAFADAQATIDATGKAQDVLRRVVVAVDLTDANAHRIPGGAIVSRDSICKRFAVTNGSLNIYDSFLTPVGGGNVYCDPVNSSGTPSP